MEIEPSDDDRGHEGDEKASFPRQAAKREEGAHCQDWSWQEKESQMREDTPVDKRAARPNESRLSCAAQEKIDSFPQFIAASASSAG